VATLVNLGGILHFNLGTGPNPEGLLGQVWIACDHSDGPTHGNVYMLCSVDPPGVDPLDVMFARSTDGGQTWSAPLRINDDAQAFGHWQWFGTMSVAPNGRIDVIWNDTRAWAQSKVCEVYYSSSADGGLSWSPNVPISPLFKSDLGYPVQKKLGDYYHMISDDTGANLAYAATFNFEQDIYFLRIPVCQDAGLLSLDSTAYACESMLAATVNDCGLNLDPELPDTATVTIVSASEPAGETITLTETAPDSGVFEGNITLSASGAPGVLRVADGDAVTVTYLDADDGAGGKDIHVTAAAVVDCLPPAITDVLVTEITSQSAEIHFTADEPVRATVFYGLACGELDQEATHPAFTSAPAVALAELEMFTKYYFAVQAEDLAGNSTYDDQGGQCYVFKTLVGPHAVYSFPLDADPGWSVQGEWAFGQPTGQGGTSWGYPDPASGATGANVYGVNLKGDYAITPGGPYYLTLGPVDLSAVQQTTLRFQRWLNSDFEPYVIDTVAVSSNGASWTEIWSNGDWEIAENAWSLQVYDVAAFADQQPTVHFRWGYEIGSGAWAYSGWNLDDIEVWGLLPPTSQGDLNCDGVVDTADVDPFVLALVDPAGYSAQYPECDLLRADCNGDGVVNAFDIDGFIELLPSP
jgi:hypothetical protein